MSHHTRRLALAAALAVATLPAGAHETLHDVQRGKAIAVRSFFADGEVLASAAFEIYSPADPKIPWQKGRTDRAGWLAFTPDRPGTWRVRVIDATGHGLDLEVDAGLPPDTGSAPTAAGSTVAFVLRPLLGLVLIAVVFAALVLAYRKKKEIP